MVSARSVWKLVTFDLDLDLENYFCILLIQTISFEWFDVATLVSVWRGHLQNIYVVVHFQGHCFKIKGTRAKKR